MTLHQQLSGDVLDVSKPLGPERNASKPSRHNHQYAGFVSELEQVRQPRARRVFAVVVIVVFEYGCVCRGSSIILVVVAATRRVAIGTASGTRYLFQYPIGPL
jgi:hypothetical protein